jgi:hypothetical protein
MLPAKAPPVATEPRSTDIPVCAEEPSAAFEHRRPARHARTTDRAPEDFLTTPLPTTFQLREQLFPPEAIRVYWTQHLPDVANLTHNNQPLYEPPVWLPLTPEEPAYLSDHRGDRVNYERLILHGSTPNIFPPKPEEILQCLDDLKKSSSLFDALLTQFADNVVDSIGEKKKPRSA